MSEGEANLRQAFEEWCKGSHVETIGYFLDMRFYEGRYVHFRVQALWLAFKAGADLIMYHPYG